MSIVFKISRTGKDVTDSTDPNDFIFDSTYNTFKIIDEGIESTKSVSSNPTTFTVAHGQSSTPAFFAFAKFPDGYIALPNQKQRNDPPPVQRYWFAEADDTYLYFIFYKGTTTTYNVDIKWYVFETPLE